MHDNARLAAVDIETTGLSPISERVVSIAVSCDDETVVWESSNERRLLDDFAGWLKSRADSGLTLTTWNGSAFDWPFLSTRSAATGSSLAELIELKPDESRYPQYGPLDGHDCGYLVFIPGFTHVDAMLPWRDISKSTGDRWALKAVARRNGIEVIEVDRTKIDQLTAAELAAYNVSDVDATRKLAGMLGPELDVWVDTK